MNGTETVVNGGGLIFERLSKVMEEVGAIEKSAENMVQKFKYRSIDQVMNALQPALIRNKVVIIPEVLSAERSEKANKSGGFMTVTLIRVRYRFITTDGSYVDTFVYGEGADSGDKSLNKALSSAFKYACFQTFCIPTEEMKDPDSEHTEFIAETPVPEKQAAVYQQTSGRQEFIPQAPYMNGYPVPSVTINSLDDALRYLVSFGPNAGKSMGQIASEPRGGETLNRFMMQNPDSAEARAAQIILRSRVM